jgi:uncharacterized membrane protein YccC
MVAAAPWKKLPRFGPFRWGAVAPWRAARVAFGVVVPLTVGWMTGNVVYGAFTALGALPAGLASFQGETRSRLAVVVAASIGMALSTFVGATVAAISPWLLVPILAIWAYFTGLAVCLGPRASVAVLQWSIALLIAVGVPAGYKDAAVRACLVLAGGLFQAVLVAISWAVWPGSKERTALAASYRLLADYASDLAANKFRGPSPAAFPATGALADANPLLSSAIRLTFVDLLEEAERIRASLASLAALAAHATDVRERGGDELRILLGTAAAALALMAQALTTPRAGRVHLLREVRQSLFYRSAPPTAPWRWAGEALLGQLRAVVRIIARLEAVRSQQLPQSGESVWRLEGSDGGLGWMMISLRANLTTHSEAGRHAIRLAAIAALAEAIVQALDFYQGRWAALTVLLVLRPDYASTLYSGVYRALGTAIGAALGAAAVLGHPGEAQQVATAGLFIAAAYAFFDLHYLLFTVFLTAFVISLLNLIGSPAMPIAEARFFETLLGACLALAGYLLWPTWEGATAQEKFARLVETHRDFANGLLRALSRPGILDASRLRALQAAARRARSDAEAATARLADEPLHAPLTPNLAETVIAVAARLGHASLGLHAFVLSQHSSIPGANPIVANRLDALGNGLDTAMTRLAYALRTLHAPEPVPSLRPLHAALRAEPSLRGAAVVGLMDRLVDAVDTLDYILRDRLPARTGAPPAPVAWQPVWANSR